MACEPVRMDTSGSFKYIQIICQTDQGDQTVVRGWRDCDYHADILDKFQKDEPQNGKVWCPGGGRITIDGQKITVFGYSIGFGRANHEKTCEILKEAMPGFHMEWNNEGY